MFNRILLLAVLAVNTGGESEAQRDAQSTRRRGVEVPCFFYSYLGDFVFYPWCFVLAVLSSMLYIIFSVFLLYMFIHGFVFGVSY